VAEGALSFPGLAKLGLDVGSGKQKEEFHQVSFTHTTTIARAAVSILFPEIGGCDDAWHHEFDRFVMATTPPSKKKKKK
jgi:hypothetical protein